MYGGYKTVHSVAMFKSHDTEYRCLLSSKPTSSAPMRMYMDSDDNTIPFFLDACLYLV